MNIVLVVFNLMSEDLNNYCLHKNYLFILHWNFSQKIIKLEYLCALRFSTLLFCYLLDLIFFSFGWTNCINGDLEGLEKIERSASATLAKNDFCFVRAMRLHAILSSNRCQNYQSFIF